MSAQGEKKQRGEDKKLEVKILEVLKRVGSLGTSFKAEDIVVNIVEQVKAQKRELTSSMKAELKNYLSGINVTKEVDKILSKYHINVDAKLSFQRKDDDKGEGRGKSE